MRVCRGLQLALVPWGAAGVPSPLARRQGNLAGYSSRVGGQPWPRPPAGYSSRVGGTWPRLFVEGRRGSPVGNRANFSPLGTARTSPRSPRSPGSPQAPGGLWWSYSSRVVGTPPPGGRGALAPGGRVPLAPGRQGIPPPLVISRILPPAGHLTDLPWGAPWSSHGFALGGPLVISRIPPPGSPASGRDSGRAREDSRGSFWMEWLRIEF